MQQSVGRDAVGTGAAGLPVQGGETSSGLLDDGDQGGHIVQVQLRLRGDVDSASATMQ